TTWEKSRPHRTAAVARERRAPRHSIAARTLACRCARGPTAKYRPRAVPVARSLAPAEERRVFCPSPHLAEGLVRARDHKHTSDPELRRNRETAGATRRK